MGRATQPGVVVEEGGRIEGPVVAELEGPTITGRLRKGYTMQIGAGRTARTLFGPAQVSLDRRTAKLHMHKFENLAEIRAAFGWPQPALRESLEESVQKRVNALAERNRGRGSAGMVGPPVDAMVREAVTREVGALRAELPGMIAAAMAELQRKERTDKQPPRPPTRAVTTKV